MSKLPAILIYPSDWLSDEIAGCSLAAQGLWLRMMFLMHRSSRYGYLTLPNGSAIPPKSVAAQCGIDHKAYVALLDELDSVGKLSRDTTGVIYSRRMVRDEQKRSGDRKRKQKERTNKGKRDVTAVVTPDVTEGVTQPVTQLSTVIAFASSIKEERQKQTSPPAPILALPPSSEMTAMDEMIGRCFTHFLSVTRHHPTTYTLSEHRRAKARQRAKERLKVHQGDLAKVEADFCKAIDNVGANAFLVEKGHTGWNEQIFRSQDEFEKRLSWKESGTGASTSREIIYTPLEELSR